MKKEFREITVKKEVYVAEDGTVFETEDECSEYEFDIMAKSLKCYDGKLNETNIYDCVFVDLATDEDVTKFQYVGEGEFTTDGIDGPGLYMYGCEDEWVNLDKVMTKIRGGKEE